MITYAKVSNFFEKEREFWQENKNGILECVEWPYWKREYIDGVLVDEDSVFIQQDEMERGI